MRHQHGKMFVNHFNRIYTDDVIFHQNMSERTSIIEL